MKQGRHFLGGKGSRKPKDHTEQMIRDASDAIKAKEQAEIRRSKTVMLKRCK
jgi:hypothetical protein